jgi:hypothetical protein
MLAARVERKNCLAAIAISNFDVTPFLAVAAEFQPAEPGRGLRARAMQAIERG